MPDQTHANYCQTLTTNEYIREVKISGWPAFCDRLWQRNYYEHIVRDEASLNRICEYIEGNPARWAEDSQNPDNVGAGLCACPESPRDIDIVLFMQGDFKLEDVPRECQTLFSHADAEARFGASIFWLRDGMLSEEMADEFLDTWQTKGMVQNAVCRGDEMIKNEMELAVTRERLAKMERFLEELRKTARPEEWPALSSGYRLEMERMQGEILDFLATPVSSGRAFA